jgi:hypothetical protein
MPPLSTYLADRLSRLHYRGEAYSFPANLFLALSLADPGPSGSGLVEPVGGAYARKSVTRNTTNFTDGTAGLITNAVEIAFVTATADWGTITHWAVFDALTGGNMLSYAALTSPRVITDQDLFRFQVGQLAITYKNAL